MIKNVFFMCIIFSAVLINFSCKPSKPNVHSLVKKWETDTVFKVPESVLYNKDSNILYVSNVDGKDSWAADGKGSISKMGADGKNIITDWVTGLNSPKGLGLYNGKLYVADLVEIIVIDIATGTIEKKIPVAGAVGLNDISVDKDGVIYVTDSQGKKAFKVKNDAVEIIAENLKSPNGILAADGVIYLLENGALNKINADKTLTELATGLKGGLDGVEIINSKDFIVTGWDGVISYVYGDGKIEKLLDTRSEKINTADLGIDATTHTIFIPSFWKNSVTAYEVK